MLAWLFIAAARAQEATDPTALITDVITGDPNLGMSTAVRLILFLTGLVFVPALVVVMTPFVRFVVVLSLLRQALGLNQSPPNQVIIGVAMFMTLLVMQPTLTAAWDGGIAPFMDGRVEFRQGLEATMTPWRGFMLDNTRREEMAAVMDLTGLARPETLDEIPTSAVVLAYVLSELKTAFVISVYMFIPFLVVEIIVSSILLGMGMMMLPPPLVSLPFKLMVFVLMDGWVLLTRNLVEGIVR